MSDNKPEQKVDYVFAPIVVQRIRGLRDSEGNLMYPEDEADGKIEPGIVRIM